MARRLPPLLLVLFAVTCAAAGASRGHGAWRSPVTVVPAATDAAPRAPLVALDARGNATALWEVDTPDGYVSATADRRVGHRWSAATRRWAGVAADLAVDARGDAVAVWVAVEGDSQRVRAAYRPAGGRWQSPAFISPVSESASTPQVVLDARGRALAVWTTYGSTSTVEAASRSPVGRWHAPTVLARGAVQDVDVAMDPKGRALAVWSQSSAIRAASRSGGGRWSPPVTLSSPAEDARIPRVAVNASGAAVVLWEASVGAPVQLEAAVRPAGGRFSTPQVIGAGVTGRPRLALAPTGHAVAVWSDHDALYAAARRPGGHFGQAQTLGEGFAPDVAVDSRGNAVAVWTRSDGTNVFVHAANEPAGRPLAPGIDLAEAGRDCWMHRCLVGGQAQVAVASNGSALAVWIVNLDPGQRFGAYVQAAESR